MSEQLASPQSTYERLLDGSKDLRRKRSLDALHQVCRLLHERGASDFSYKTIITLGQDRGLSVPSEKSIVNPTGEHYRELIQSWRLISIVGKPGRGLAPDDWIERIEDTVLRLSVTLLAKELASVKAKIARKENSSDSPIYLGTIQGHAQVASKQPRLNEAELAALKGAIDPEFLSAYGLIIGSRGEVTDSKGRVMHKPGFRDAIEKILAVHVR